MLYNRLGHLPLTSRIPLSPSTPRHDTIYLQVLEDMLYNRNWEGLPAHTAHKKKIQQMSEAYDATPGAYPNHCHSTLSLDLMEL